MYKIISLNGEWSLNGCDKDNNPIAITAAVPGYVHPAMEKAGLLEPIYYRDNAEKCQWIEDKEWIFSKIITVPEDTELQNAELRFDGVDTYADIILNGKCIYKTSNMFLPFTVKVGDTLKHGENELKVAIYPYKPFVEGKPERNAAFTWDRLYVRRVQCTFFWDWVNRYVSAGIWGNVELAFPEEAVIEDVFIETADICETSASLRLQIKTENALATGCRFKVDIKAPNGETAWDAAGRVFMNTLYLQADIAEPELWWPSGYGEHPLYTVTVALINKDGKELDKKTKRVGIRTVRLEMLRDKPGSEEERRTNEIREYYNQQDNPNTGESYIILVNGKRIFSKGGNWVPASPFPGTVTDEHYRRLIESAARCNMNVLRVWGGGIYEPEIFYDLCDEYGIMITQDFMLACGTYPDDDEEFVESYKKEVRATVLRLRSRTCIMVWTGNNENGDGFDWDDPETKNMSLQEAVYIPVMNELNPNRPYRLYGSYGGRQNTDMTVGDSHDGYWLKGAENVDVSCFDRVGRFSSESSIEGYPLPSSLRKFLSEEDILDPDSPITDYHIKNNIYFPMMGMLSVHDRVKKSTEVVLGNVEERYSQIYRLAYIQYEWARLTIEGTRRSKWYSSGLQFWMYNDCWPALGYSLIDFYGNPKAGSYAAKYSGAPIAASIKYENGALKPMILNDSFESGSLSYKLKLYSPEKGISEIADGEAAYLPNVNTEIISIAAEDLEIKSDSSIIVFLELYRDGKMISRARWYPDWLSRLELPVAPLAYELDYESNILSITCKKGVALGVAIDGELTAEDNYIDILEGETAQIAYNPLEGFEEITVYGYNTAIEKI